ncbi:hypothetical protein LZ32DRAFT_24862 [Colletotrichum eremochloae]|nr:hypothetical protein LZ32DRAFT_24862 [Colletotrichum eremochloae]
MADDTTSISAITITITTTLPVGTCRPTSTSINSASKEPFLPPPPPPPHMFDPKRSLPGLVLRKAPLLVAPPSRKVPSNSSCSSSLATRKLCLPPARPYRRIPPLLVSRIRPLNHQIVALRRNTSHRWPSLDQRRNPTTPSQPSTYLHSYLVTRRPSVSHVCSSRHPSHLIPSRSSRPPKRMKPVAVESLSLCVVSPPYTYTSLLRPLYPSLTLSFVLIHYLIPLLPLPAAYENVLSLTFWPLSLLLL